MIVSEANCAYCSKATEKPTSRIVSERAAISYHTKKSLVKMLRKQCHCFNRFIIRRVPAIEDRHDTRCRRVWHHGSTALVQTSGNGAILGRRSSRVCSMDEITVTSGIVVLFLKPDEARVNM